MRMKRCANLKNKALWFSLGLAGGLAAVRLSRRRGAARAAAWERQFSPAGSAALVTGASSGIGAAYARQLAERGYSVVLVARREDRLKELAAELEQRFGVPVEVLTADLATESGIARVEARLAYGQPVDLLVNNAGYDVLGSFAVVPIEKTIALINCLELGVVRLSRAALPGMLARRRGAIVNVSSISAFLPRPFDATYAASKAYLNQFSESLAAELAGSGVRVQALCPGFTRTEFHDTPELEPYRVKQRVPRWLWMAPDQVVDASLRALAQDRRLCVPGLKNQLVVAAGRTGLGAALLDVLKRVLRPGSGSVSLRWAAHWGRSTEDDLLEVIACPRCHGRLELQGTFSQGCLACSRCAEEYPVLAGIPGFARYQDLNPSDVGFARLYDWFSYFYLPASKIASAFLGGERKVRRKLLDRLDLRQGRTLEVSIGPGVNLPYLLEYPQAGEVYGLDLSIGQLRRCQDYAQREGLPVRLYQGNAEALPFQDESFDTVFHIGGINFFSDKKKAIEEMIRVAKPGAKILIADETERGARGFELSLPGFGKLLAKERAPVSPPLDLVPAEMLDVRLEDAPWHGWFYCLEFRKPYVR